MIRTLAQLDLPLRAPDLAPPRLDPVEESIVDSATLSALDLLNSYAHVFVAGFLVTLLLTPIVRRVAIAGGVIDHPDGQRKMHGYPVAYLGGIAVFFGLIVAIAVSYFTDDYTQKYLPVPLSIIFGMVAITVTGLADDIWGWDPRLKIAGQLVAAAALAINDIGVRVAEGLLTPLMGSADQILLTVLDFHLLNDHLYYWTGTALIAVFVLGGCNSANLLDGLDGLLSGVVAIVAVGLLAIGLLLAPQDFRFGEQARGEAELVALAVQGHEEVYAQTHGRHPRTLEELAAATPAAAREGDPVLPVGFGLRLDAAEGKVRVSDDRASVAAALRKRVHGFVRTYYNREGSFPLTLDDLVPKEMNEQPEMPSGYGLRYNPNTGRVFARGEGEASMAGARIVLCLALLGAVLGFLPHNFNPATIFLGDCGSLLLGYMCVVIILLLGARGETYYVFAGLIVFAIPGIDTTLAIIRRRMAGTSLSAADNQHLHHQLKRALGSVPRAVLALYAIGMVFAAVGVSLVVAVMSGLRVRFIYAIVLVLFGFIAVIAVKAGQRQKLLVTAKAK